MKEYVLDIKYSGARRSVVYIDGRKYELNSGHNGISLARGSHRVKICMSNILNTHFWWLKVFCLPMYIYYPFGMTFEAGMDGFFPQVEFDLFITDNCKIKVDLLKKDQSAYFGKIVYRWRYDYLLDNCKTEIKNLNYNVPLSKTYKLKWRIVHGIVPTILLCTYLWFYVISNLGDNLWLHGFAIVELALMFKLAFFTDKKRKYEKERKK